MNTKLKALICVLMAAAMMASFTACRGAGELSSNIPLSENESTTISNISSSSTLSEILADSSSMVSGDTSKNPAGSSLPDSSSSLNNSPSNLLNSLSSDRSDNSSSILPNSSSSSAMGEVPLASVPGSSANTDVPIPFEKDEKILIAYFSRWGNTDYPNDVDATTSASIVVDNGRFGTTEYTARMIQEAVGGDILPIETAAPYTADFDELRDVNHKEMADNFLPALKKTDLDISKYDTVFIGYPVWATDVPQAVISFLKMHDLSDKKVIPFCTHDGYGAGRSYSTIASASRAKNVANGLAIEAKDVPSAKSMVTSWLSSVGFSQRGSTNTAETAIKIKIGETVIDGVIYDTALAREIKEYFPLAISMSGYGGREYYGGVDFYPNNVQGGKKTFENGDITYCEDHHNMAIFYAQTNNPTLSVDVIPIGKVTSDLSVFGNFGSRETVTFSLAE
ncbi:MAG: hypothetical protein K2N56_11335 [Oscillospiraceae bacterium]|nr:hypothetical protein [Oscillospiraceae bacterium]